jgi:hypothetical protein
MRSWRLSKDPTDFSNRREEESALRQKLEAIKAAVEPLVSGECGGHRIILNSRDQNNTLETLCNKEVTIGKCDSYAQQALVEAKERYATRMKQKDEKLASSLRKTLLRQDPRKSFHRASESSGSLSS